MKKCLLLLSVFLGSASAETQGTKPCSGLFGSLEQNVRRLATATKTKSILYWHEVIATRGLALMLRERGLVFSLDENGRPLATRENYTDPKRLFAGLLTQTPRQSKENWWTYRKRMAERFSLLNKIDSKYFEFDFTPVEMLKYQAHKKIQTPILKKVFSNAENLHLGGLGFRVAELATFILAYNKFDATFWDWIKHRDMESIDEFTNEDYRGEFVKKFVKDKNLPKEAGSFLTLQALGLYQKYYDSIEAKFSTKEARQEKLITLQIFSDIKTIATTPFKSGKDPRFEKLINAPEEEEPLGKDRVSKLIELREATLNKLRVIPYLVSDPKINANEEQAFRTDLEYGNLIKKLEASPFFKKLNELRKSGKITSKKMSYLLMEDIDWQERFFRFEILGLKPLKMISASEATKEALTLQDIRDETLSNYTR